MNSEFIEIGERIENGPFSLKEKISVINMAIGDHLKEGNPFFTQEFFENLDNLILKTIHGAKIEHFKPQKDLNPFHIFEIRSEKGDSLGYLHMIYIRNPIPCYYLIYVEVLESFRGRGLGKMMLKSFREFVEVKNAIGLLDNIIPPQDPTYNIYAKLGWKNIKELIGETVREESYNYMIFIPHSMNIRRLKEKLIRLLFKISKKRPLIEMHDNEIMVRRTISEFQRVYETLSHLFEKDLLSDEPDPLACFLFTKFIAKLLTFRRRISKLIGYTLEESLEQLNVSDKIKDLPILSYSLWRGNNIKPEIWGEEGIIKNLPEELIKNPTLYIESLPLYKRPFLLSWLKRKGEMNQRRFKIRDLFELGFDPTRLKEFHMDEKDYIFERVSPHFLPSIERRKKLLEKIAKESIKLKIQNATIQINLPLVLILDRGNLYILRKKLEGIHLEEALEQIKTVSYLRTMNLSIGIDRIFISTTIEVKKWLMKKFGYNFREEIEDLAFFIPWDIGKNMPLLNIDVSKVYLEKIWVS